MKVESNFNPEAGMFSTKLVLYISFMLFFSCKFSLEKKFEPKQLVQQQSYSFSVGEVKLLDGPFKTSMEAEVTYLLSLDLDRMIAPFRKESRLEPKAQAYPGWETKSLPGVALSFYLSGISRMYAISGDKEYKRKMDYILEELAECQKQNNGFLLGSSGAVEIFAKLEKDGFYEEFDDWNNGHGEPYYVIEKLFSGLIDAYRIGGSKAALDIAIRLADWLEGHMSHIDDINLEKIMTVEYGGMNWVLADMYAITGNKKYLAMSERWHDKSVVIPMTEEKDVLTNIHANTQFPKMCGLAARYLYTADSTELKGARFFWESVVNHRIYVTGGNSESEYFASRDTLSNKLTPFTEENCNEYNMLKLTSLLFTIEPRVEYANYMERTMLNHLLSAQNVDDGRVCYFLPLMSGAEKTYQGLYDIFSCCVCSSMDSYTRHSEYIYAHNANDIFINQFIASEVNWKEKGIVLTQKNRFPYEDVTSLSISCGKDVEMGIKIRYPYWMSSPMEIKINSEFIKEVDHEDGYCNIKRVWNDGDVVEIKTPMSIRLENMPDDKSKIAFFYGPVLLAGVFNREEADSLVEANYLPGLIPGDKPLEQWLSSSGEPLRFTMNVSPQRPIELKPFFTINSGPYSVYWQLMNNKEWNDRKQAYKKTGLLREQLDKITIDKVVATDSISEHGHQLEGISRTGKGNKGILPDKPWRQTTLGSKGLSYQMNVHGDPKVSLYCKFMGREQYERWDCKIKIDTTTIALLKRGKDDSYPVMPFETRYPIPLELTKGKKIVRVSFDARNVSMPRVMEMRIIKGN